MKNNSKDQAKEAALDAARTAAEEASLPCDPPEESREDEFIKDEWRVHMDSSRVRDYEGLVRECKVDLDLWTVDRFKVKSYEVTYVPRSTRAKGNQKWIRASSKAVTVPMFAISASFKRRHEVQDARDVLAEVKRQFAALWPRKPEPVPAAATLTGNVLELNISDHHFGKLAWGKETGGPDWDLGLAQKSWRSAVSYVLAGTAHYTYDEVILVVGNDIVHVDGLESNTTAGTRVDSDSRYPKVYTAVVGEVLWTIRILKAKGMRVRVVIVPGNHDTVSCFTIGVALSLVFSGDPGVTVDNEPTHKKVYAFGKCLVGWEHGNTGKHKERPLNMAVEHPALWGSTEHREIHTGHVHHVVAEDIQSVIVRKVAALGPNDAWHAKNGYMAQRNVEAFIWNKERGLIGTCVYVAPAGRPLLTREGVA